MKSGSWKSGESSIVCNLVPLCSEPLPELTDQTNLPRRAAGEREPFLSSAVLHYLKQSTGRRRRRGVVKKKKSRGCHHFILIPSPSTPSHSLIPLMRSVQAEACSRRQQFYSAICASHIGWQGGERGLSGAQPRRRGEGKENEIQSGQRRYLVGFCLRHLSVLL